MNGVDNVVDEKTFYMKEEEEDEVLRQLREIHRLQAPSSATSSSGGASSGQNNNYKYSEGEAASLRPTEGMDSASAPPTTTTTTAVLTPAMFDATALKTENSPQSFSIHQQFFQRDDSPLLLPQQQDRLLLQQQQQQQQIFAYAMSPNTEAQLSNSSALQNTITSLSCKGNISRSSASDDIDCFGVVPGEIIKKWKSSKNGICSFFV